MGMSHSYILRKVIQYSRAEAVRLCSRAITPDHLMLGLMRAGENFALGILQATKVDLFKMKSTLDQQLSGHELHLVTDADEIPYDQPSHRVMRDAYNEALNAESDFINEGHLLLGILLKDDSHSYALLQAAGVDYSRYKELIQPFLAQSVEDIQVKLSDFQVFEEGVRRERSSRNFDSEQEQVAEESSDHSLANYTVNLTERARHGLLDPVVGRERETERVVQILSRRKKNNPILIGDPGVGKSAIVEGLAIRIVENRVPVSLIDREILMLDMASVVAGTKFRGEFEERMQFFINELRRNPHIILFIDEIHTIVGAGSASGTLDAANILKPALARGDVNCIGATTLDEFRESIESDGALERRFQKVLVEPSSEEETLQILKSIQGRYEEHHNVRYTHEALRACVSLTVRYISERALPDKAIDAMDEVGSRVSLAAHPVPSRVKWLEEEISKREGEKVALLRAGNPEEAALLLAQVDELKEEQRHAIKRWRDEKPAPASIDENDVASVVAMMTNVPVERVVQKEGVRLLEMEEALKASVVGQDHAIEAIARAIRRNRSGLRDPNRPIGTFLFLGPTGVGKTHLAKVLARYLFESEKNFIRIDMNEYLESFSTSRLIGSPPGYVGYGEGGQLTERVRRHPYSVVLLDEIEKASPDVYNILLQMLDEGHLTDGNGRKVDFKNTLIIMTSNIGSRQLREFGLGIGFSTSHRTEKASEHTRHFISKELEKRFPPEFLNRVDEQVFFDSLGEEEIAQILTIELRAVSTRLNELGVHLKLTQRVKEFLITESYDAKFGARPLKRAIQRHVEDTLATLLLGQELSKSFDVVLDYSPDRGVFASIEREAQKQPLVASEHNLS